ncbi:MAG: hypothetical protein IT371_30325 [Deltaproteobacteria bacterium]|nr:hypothetical protein [Deltaproteobacteria bacterium]
MTLDKNARRRALARAEREANAKAAALEAERKAAEAERKAVRRAQEARKRAVRKTPSTLFHGSAEANARLTAVLDALDFLACEDADGWVKLPVWVAHLRRAGYEGKGESAERLWTRRLTRMRKHGIDYHVFASDAFGGLGRAGVTLGALEDAYETGSLDGDRTAFRLTPEGLDRLRALVAALDDWLCSRKDGDV